MILKICESILEEIYDIFLLKKKKKQMIMMKAFKENNGGEIQDD